MELFEQVLVGIIGIAVLFFFWPGAKRAMEQSRQAENPDWMSVLISIFLVVLFVILLVFLARG